MKTEYNNKEEKLAFFTSLYENAKNSYSDIIEKYDRHMNQYRGSDGIDGSHERAATVRNITYEIIESQLSGDIPLPKVDPMCYSERKNRNARSAERLLISLRDKLPFEKLNDFDERYTYIYGGSVWYVEWDNTEKLGKEVGSVKVFCLSPKDFIPQPSVNEIDDMEYCFLRFTTTRGELMRKYAVSEDDISLAEFNIESSVPSELDTVQIVIAFYKDENGEIGKFCFSGDLVLIDIPRFYRRKVKTCASCKDALDICRCKTKKETITDQLYEIIDKDINLSDGTRIPHLSPLLDGGNLIKSGKDYLMGRTALPYYTPKSFPIIIRKNTSLAGSLLGQSDCEYIRPEQQAINKIESRILQKLLRSGITPIMPEDASISINNSVFGQVIRMKPGESADRYGKVDTTPDISQDIMEAERLYDHSKRILGISDALQGLDTHVAESGYSRQLKISQATGRLESKRRMKHAAYADLDRIIFEQYLAFADEPRNLVYKDAYGRVHNAEFNRYDFLEYDTASGKYYYDDAYLFSVDLNAGNEYQRESLWERNLENLKSGSLGDPKSNVTLLRYWQCQERAHYPHARENVEYFTLAIEKGEMLNEEFGKP